MHEKKRILIVEDEFLLASLLSDILSDNGFDIVGKAHNVKKALDIINTNPPSAAILDYNLRGETSHSLGERLQEENIPFLFLTGTSDIQLLQTAFPDVSIMAKPVREPALMKELSKVLGTSEVLSDNH